MDIPVTLIDDFDYLVNYFKPSLCPYSTINKLGEVKMYCKVQNATYVLHFLNENCSP